jgi:hypothetical protein
MELLQPLKLWGKATFTRSINDEESITFIITEWFFPVILRLRRKLIIAAEMSHFGLLSRKWTLKVLNLSLFLSFRVTHSSHADTSA